MTRVLQGMLWPRTVDEATALLADDPEAKPLAGGATLVAMMNARVLEPHALVSLSRIDELQGIRSEADGGMRIGAFTRHRETAAVRAAARRRRASCAQAAAQIANATVRNMGTIGGSISFADPGLDYPPALVAAGASDRDRRRVADAGASPARDFFVDWYTTALEPGEIVTAVLLPAPQPGGAAVREARARVAATTPPPRRRSASTAPDAVARRRSARAARRRSRDDDADALLTGDRSDAGDRPRRRPARGARRSARRRARQRRVPAPAHSRACCCARSAGPKRAPTA